MKRRRSLLGLSVSAILLVSGSQVSAGPYGDDMGKCLVKATTSEERGMLVRWIFAIASIHPAVSGISSVTDAQRTEFCKAAAALYESLLTDRCKTQVEDAVKYEGSGTVQTAFSVLGQAAMMELFSNADVEKGLQEYVQYLDKAKLEAVFGKQSPSPE